MPKLGETIVPRNRLATVRPSETGARAPLTPSPKGSEVSPPPGPKTTYRKSKGEGISPALADLKARFRRHYYFSDDDVIDVVLGTVAGNRSDNDPLWL